MCMMAGSLPQPEDVMKEKYVWRSRGSRLFAAISGRRELEDSMAFGFKAREFVPILPGQILWSDC